MAALGSVGPMGMTIYEAAIPVVALNERL